MEKKKLLVISTSLRAQSNSEALARAFAQGAQAAGHEAEVISLRGKKLGFCLGCFQCQETGKCVLRDDAAMIEEKVLAADVVAWATPIYYYEMSGQMKTLIDRLNPLFPKDYRFRDVYFLATASEDEETVPQRALSGLQGWVDCFEKAELKGSLFCGGMDEQGAMQGNNTLKLAYEMGKRI